MGMAVGDITQFDYTGTIQTFTVPENGLYQFELYGAKGGNENSGSVAGANGAKVISYHELKKGTVLYIGCGGAGGASYSGWNGGAYAGTAGYNGGGAGYSYFANNYDRRAGGGGGGATHIATENGLINEISQESMLAVAGGGAGSGWRAYYNNGTAYASFAGSTIAQSNGIVGKGTNGTSNTPFYAGGGGGYYGGSMGYSGTNKADSISYKGTDYTATNVQGANSGNGYAKITLVAKSASLPVYLGDIELVGIFLGSTEIVTG